MSRYHREYPDMEPDAATERLYAYGDYLRDEMQDRKWEEALERDAEPWDVQDAFSLTKEHEFFESERELRTEASESRPPSEVGHGDSHCHGAAPVPLQAPINTL